MRPHQIQQIARSIAKFGFNVPLLVDRQLNLIAGHGRLAGAEIVGLKTVPVIRLEHLDENQRRAFLIADNRLTENAEWNNQLLGEQFKLLAGAEIDFSLEITGFEMGEIDCFIEGLTERSGTDPDPADQLPDQAGKPPVSKAGDLWILDKHRVLCGNALREADVARLMGRQKVSAVFADAPSRECRDSLAVSSFSTTYKPVEAPKTTEVVKDRKSCGSDCGSRFSIFPTSHGRCVPCPSRFSAWMSDSR